MYSNPSHYIIYFSHCYDKILDEGRIRKEKVYFGSLFEGIVRHGKGVMRVGVWGG